MLMYIVNDSVKDGTLQTDGYHYQWKVKSVAQGPLP